MASLMMDLNMRKSNEVREDLVRHMILNSIRMYRTDFHQEFGEWFLLMILNITGEETIFLIIRIWS